MNTVYKMIRALRDEMKSTSQQPTCLPCFLSARAGTMNRKCHIHNSCQAADVGDEMKRVDLSTFRCSKNVTALVQRDVTSCDDDEQAAEDRDRDGHSTVIRARK